MRARTSLGPAAGPIVSANRFRMPAGRAPFPARAEAARSMNSSSARSIASAGRSSYQSSMRVRPEKSPAHAWSRFWSRSWFLLRRRPGHRWGMAFPVDHDRALERNYDGPVLVVAGRLHRHDPHVRSAPRCALFEHLGLGVDGVALEDGGGEPNLVPPQIGHDVLGDVGDALAGHQRDRERRVHERLAELGLGRVVVVEVDRGGILRQQREPGVVGGGDGAPQRVLVHVAHLEVLEKPSPPTLFNGHASLLLLALTIPYRGEPESCLRWAAVRPTVEGRGDLLPRRPGAQEEREQEAGLATVERPGVDEAA